MNFCSIFFSPSLENTTDVWVSDKGKNAKGPFFVKIWTAVLFLIFRWLIKVVKADPLYFFSIILWKNFLVIGLFCSELIIRLYFLFLRKL